MPGNRMDEGLRNLEAAGSKFPNRFLFIILYYINPVKICSDSQSLSEIPANLVVYVLRIVKM